uniref:A disintegrin and metalloproteinase with thrombospondin motifs 18-like n=1 Tax=Saccoglossus kowalevskii TaxID=10224 RepID=A0ABM0LVM6_SACKO|nr:PREDICTED: A disintegrin and metalloproteinase with thrombospondin motifs 18-like [Saccoglossus kowalevskii]
MTSVRTGVSTYVKDCIKTGVKEGIKTSVRTGVTTCVKAGVTAVCVSSGGHVLDRIDCWIYLPIGTITTILPFVMNIFVMVSFLGHASSASAGNGITEEPVYEMVIPVQIDEHGEYLSHNLWPHRSKRDNTENVEQIHYSVSGYGQDFRLQLEPNEKLITPGLSLQWRRKESTYTTELDITEHCFYRGRLLSHKNTTVAISTCNGLRGLLRTEDEDYLLEPLPVHLHTVHNVNQETEHQPHMLYKRSNLHRVLRNTEEHGEMFHSNNSHKQHYCGRKKNTAPLNYQIIVQDMDKYAPPYLHILIHQPHVPMKPFILNDEYMDGSIREKRSIGSNEIPTSRSVETLVVVDEKMLENHGSENVTTYVLTVLNMVSSLFQDGSIGDSVDIALVSLVLLEDAQAGLSISNHADHSLQSFCQWQSTLQSLNGSRHDHAILLTGMDICSYKNEPCDTLGFAPINGMCSKYRSCTINEDTGLGLAFTIAHESGHNFGMIHDGEGNDCSKSRGHIMSPTMTGNNNGIFSWSQCSREYLENFLSSSKAVCLLDQPAAITGYEFPAKLPGELYDADMQCKWQFGESAKLCTFDFGKSLCKALWCHKNQRQCETKFLPAAEGTSCGHSKWCRRGVCVNYGDAGPSVIHGNWSAYAEYGECSRTCGGGITYKERECNNPKPQYGGRYCQGDSKSYRMCNIQDCPSNDIDFRSQQCAAYNSKPFRGFYYKWKPYTHVDRKESCKLYCIAEDYDFFFALSSKVMDGTPCREDSLDVCVNGKCESVGCDHVLGSSTRFDGCGVCNGDNTTCDFIKGVFMEQPAHNDYYPIVVVPEGARNILVEEVNISSSYLAIRNEHHEYYLTGDWTVDWPGEFKMAGTSFVYSREYNKPESLSAPGPTNEEIVIELLLQGMNPGVKYFYALSNSDNGTVKEQIYNYTWSAIMTECSVTCAGGEMTTISQCWRDYKEQVDESYCDLELKPHSGSYPCNLEPCPASWVLSEWGDCDRKCGGGRQKRKVQCIRQITQTRQKSVKAAFCPGSRPQRWMTCNTQECPPKWIAAKWSQCTKTCGGGFQARQVTCRSTNQGGLATSCIASEKPTTSQTCNKDPCPRQDPDCVDLFDWCHLVPRHNVCDHKFYGIKCCKSCTRGKR